MVYPTFTAFYVSNPKSLVRRYESHPSQNPGQKNSSLKWEMFVAHMDVQIHKFNQIRERGKGCWGERSHSALNWCKGITSFAMMVVRKIHANRIDHSSASLDQTPFRFVVPLFSSFLQCFSFHAIANLPRTRVICDMKKPAGRTKNPGFHWKWQIVSCRFRFAKQVNQSHVS